MAYKFREEIVGKRFLSVSGFTKLKVNKISEWGWRAGVIRAASHRDNGCHDLQVLVEYDDVEWQRREWLSPHRDAVFSFFLIERGLYWAERPDPRHASLIPIDHHNHANNNHHQHRINGKPLRGATAVADTIAWPALTFYPLVARAELHEDAMPIEFMQDRKLDFVDYSKLKPFTQDWELTKGTMPWGNAVRRWAEMQDGQRILLTTPSVLVGFRVEVYRAEGTTQWYTAVIVGYNESTKDLTVTDDTVLEDHNEDPTLVQMRLIGDGVVESIMRGEVVGMTPRRSRSSTALTHALVVPRPGRRPRRRPGNAAQLPATPRVQSPISQHLEKALRNENLVTAWNMHGFSTFFSTAVMQRNTSSRYTRVLFHEYEMRLCSLAFASARPLIFAAIQTMLAHTEPIFEKMEMDISEARDMENISKLRDMACFEFFNVA